MKTNRIILLTSVLCFSLLGTGCGEPLMEMTSEEEAIISLYSAKVVAKFNQNQVIGIANARVKKGELDEDYKPDEEGEEAEEIVGEENSEEAEVEIDPEIGEPIVKSEDEATEGETQEGENKSSGYSFTDAVGIEGVSFVCSEFDVTSEYKPNSSYILSKVNGKSYLVLSITATNETEETIDFSKLAKREYSLALNGGDKSKSQFTPLTNDLSSFKGKISPGDSKSFVLVFLFSDSAVDNISSLELFVTSDGESRETSI